MHCTVDMSKGFYTSDVETLPKMWVNLNSNISIDMYLNDLVRSTPAVFKLGWVKDSFHHSATDYIVVAVAFGIDAFVILVHTALTAMIDGCHVKIDRLIVDHVTAEGENARSESSGFRRCHAD
eukprot:11429638-Ditylum_brightwellii.AAC.1